MLQLLWFISCLLMWVSSRELVLKQIWFGRKGYWIVPWLHWPRDEPRQTFPTCLTCSLNLHQAPWVESISTAVVSGIQRHAQCAHVETEAAQQHQTRLQKLCDNFWNRVWFCCSRVRTNQKKVVKTTFQFQAIFPNQTLHQKDVTESALLRLRRAQ